jgi:hypothetical protein
MSFRHFRLDFYGFELVDEKTGKIRRLRGDAYEPRFHNLNTSSHNYLRITVSFLTTNGRQIYFHPSPLAYPEMSR